MGGCTATGQRSDVNPPNDGEQNNLCFTRHNEREFGPNIAVQISVLSCIHILAEFCCNANVSVDQQ